MNNIGILTTILVLGLVIGIVLNFLIGNIIHYSKKIISIFKNNNEFLKKQEAVRKMRENGDMHEWVSVPSTSGTLLVCKKTGFCPELNGFVPVEMIASYLNKLKREEEYKVFRDARVSTLAKELNLDLPKMEEIVEKIFSIKKDFTLIKLDELQKDLEKRAADVEQQG